MTMIRFVSRPVLFILFGMAVVSGPIARAQQAPGGELDLLRRDEYRQQLGLSEAQMTRLQELQTGSSPSREALDPFFERLRSAATEEDRAKIREEMNQFVAKSRTQFQDQAVGVLNEAQKKALRGLFIGAAGTRALADPRVAADLGLTDEQKAAISTLSDERRTAARGVGFNASEADRTKFEDEWKAKFLAVLNPEQKTKWDQQSTDSAAVAGQSGAVAASPGTPAAPGTTPAESTEPPPGEKAVISFGGAAVPGDGTKKVEKFSFNFRYAPWEQVLESFATAAGYTADLNVIPPGTFSHIDSNTYSAEETLDIINGYLLRRGFALVKKDGFLVCVNIDKGIPETLIPDVSLEALTKVGDHEIVRIEKAIEGVDVAVMAQEVEALLGAQGKMTAFTQTGTLIISDAGANLRRINTFIDNSLKLKKPDQIFKSYFVKNLSAEEAEFMLMTQFGMRQGAVNVASSNDGRRPPSPSTSQPTTPLQVASDSRTNSVFVTGTPVQHTLVEEIMKAIDVDKAPDGTPIDARSNSGPYLHVYQLMGSDAGEVTKSIDAMMPGVVVNDSRRDGRVHIWGTAKQHQQVQEWIEQFNGTSSGVGEVAVIPLVKMDPLSAASTLRSLFLSEGNNAPSIETDLYGRRIIVRGTVEQVTQIKTVLSQLGEDGTGVRNTSDGGGKVRRYSLQGRSPEEFLQFLQDTWKTSEPNPIRVLIPRDQSPIKDLRTPQGPIQRTPRGSEYDDSTSRRTNRRNPSGPTNPTESYFTAASAQDSASTPVAEPAAVPGQNVAPENTAPGTTSSKNAAGEPAQAAAGPAEDVSILVVGDELVLSSNDEAALDRVEEMMDALQQTLPFRPTWTVIYLQSADATEAAAMIEQLMPSATVGTTSSSSSSFSFGGMFRPVTDSVSSLTGLSGLNSSPQTLRIIPDVRSNSLYVTGPEMVVREVSQFLEILDSDEVPQSLRDMQPRTIVVRFADIDDVAKIVTDVFKPYLEVAGGRQQQQNNPLAMIMGGGGGGGGGRGNEASQVRMTIGVDRQNSSLIVSSSQSLYEQVQQLVEGLDGASQTANRSIRVLQLKNADPTVVQQSLSSLFPRVTASATRPPTAGSSSEGGGGSAPGGDRGDSSSRSSSQQQDAFQQMIQDRMRQRMQGGGDSGGSSGRPSFGGGGFGGFGGFPGGGGGFPGGGSGRGGGR